MRVLGILATGLAVLFALAVGLGVVLPMVAAVPLGYRSFSVQAGSMEPALLPGDVVFSRRAGADEMPERGDIVVFRHPGNGLEYVKRVIALEGDTVAVVDGAVVLNGTALGRAPDGTDAVPFLPTGPTGALPRCTDPVALGAPCLRARFTETQPGGRRYNVLDVGDGFGDHIEPVEVPEGHVFVLGDNRDNSLDSRFPLAVGGVGPVPVDSIDAIGARVHYSYARLGNGWTIRWDRFGKTVK